MLLPSCVPYFPAERGDPYPSSLIVADVAPRVLRTRVRVPGEGEDAGGVPGVRMRCMTLQSLKLRSRWIRGPRRRIFVTVASSTVALSALGGCSESQKRLGERAFVEAVNLKCKSDKARFEAAKRMGLELAATPEGQDVTADVQAKLDEVTKTWESLRATASKLRGPQALQDELDAGLAKLKEVPGLVAEKTITPSDAASRVEEVRSELRARGFVDCV